KFQFFSGHRDESMARLEQAFEVLSEEGPSEDLADVAAMLSRAYWFSGDLDRTLARADFALDIAEAHRYMKPLVHALRAKAAGVFSRCHIEEGEALMKHGLELALEHELVDDAATYYFILSDRCFRQDKYLDAFDYLERSLEQIHKLGSRPHEAGVLSERTYPLWMLGRWDEMLSIRAGLEEEMLDAGAVVLSLLQTGVDVYAQRGELDEARRLFHQFDRLEHSTDIQDQSTYAAVKAGLLRAEGRLEEALEAGLAALPAAEVLSPSFQGVKHGLVDALEAALALGRHDQVGDLYAFVEGIPLPSRSPFMDAQVERLRARTGED